MSKPKTQTIAQMWISFSKSVVPPNASIIQRTEMKKAFYAGATSLLSAMKGMDESLSEDEGAQILESYESELVGFLQEAAGRNK